MQNETLHLIQPFVESSEVIEWIQTKKKSDMTVTLFIWECSIDNYLFFTVMLEKHNSEKIIVYGTQVLTIIWSLVSVLELETHHCHLGVHNLWLFSHRQVVCLATWAVVLLQEFHFVHRFSVWLYGSDHLVEREIQL